MIDTGRNCLHLAAFNGGLEVCQILLKHDCDLEAQDKDGWSPLHLAAQEGHVSTVSLLWRVREKKLDNLSVTVHNREVELLSEGSWLES